jgi:hypothetical protein
MSNAPFVIQNIDIEGTRAPWATAAAPCFPLDSLEKPEQSLRRQMRIDQGDGVNVSGLARATDRRSFIEGGDGLYFDTCARDLAQCARNGLCSLAPRTGTICAQS